MTTTDRIVTTADATVRQDSASTNYGDNLTLGVLGSGGSIRYSYLHFPITVPAEATVIAASLVLTLKSAWTGGTDDLTVSRVTSTWKEGRVTYTDRPSVTATNEVTVNPDAAADATVSIDITDMAQAWVSGADRFGVRLDSDVTSTKTFYSSEAKASLRPYLSLEYAMPADAPTNLRPDAGGAISLEEPLLVWDSATPTEVEIQIDTADTFDSQTGSIPEWSSGWVAWTETSYDTADDGSPPLLIEGVTYYWRVRVRDENEVTSDWSGGAEFIYEPHGTLTITTPAADNDNVNTTTPVIAHTFTDQTQAFVEYEVYEDGVLKAYAAGKKVASVATTRELPAGLVRDQTVDYTVVVRVWDDNPRQAVGCLPYVEASRTFQLVYDGTPDPVAAFTATGTYGWVALAWTRASEPDYFAIEVDGQIIHDKLNASDLFVSGTSYAAKFYRATPLTSHTYKVHAVETTAGVDLYSDDSPSDTDTFNPLFIYLVDETASTYVTILGEGVTTELGESGNTFFPMNQQAPVRIRDIVRGLEGQVTGTLAAVTGQTAAAARSAFLAMKENPQNSLRLVWGYQNIPVVIGDSAVQLQPYGTEAYAISFDFWQVGEFEVEE